MFGVRFKSRMSQGRHHRFLPGRFKLSQVLCGSSRASRLSGLFTATLSLVLLLGSCASIPEITYPSAFTKALPSHQSAYFSLSVEKNRALLGMLADQSMDEDLPLTEALSWTGAVFGSIGLRPGAIPEVSLVVVGRYQDNLMKLFLHSDRDWEEKQKIISGRRISIFRNTESGLELAIARSSTILMTNTSVEPMLERLYSDESSSLPSDLEKNAARRAYLLIDDPARDFIPRISDGAVRLPVQKLEAWILDREEKTTEESPETGTVVEETYRFGGRAVLDTERDARLFNVLLRGLFAAWLLNENIMSLSEIKEQILIEQRENVVRVSGLELTDPELLEVLERVFLVED